MRKPLVLLFALLATTAVSAAQGRPGAPPPANVVVLPSQGPLYDIQIMVRAGSADDPQGKEGVANLVARMLIDGGFGDAQQPVTKERLAEITRPWGAASLPTVLVEKQATTFYMVVPRDAFPEFVSRVLRPMMSNPLWLGEELDRIRREQLVGIESGLRLEQQELLGLLALDNYVLDGTPLSHLAAGTVRGLRAVTRDDLTSFHRRHYRRENMYIATSIPNQEHLDLLLSAIPGGGTAASKPQPPKPAAYKPEAVRGRELLILTQPNAIATGLHLGYPIPVSRSHPDYWPLFVGNVFFGAHRDSFGRLYNLIREERGYNYGDYSYIEYLYGRPYFLFPPPTTPRTAQYFSMWIRPVGDGYTHFIMKAMTAELERLIREGLTPEQVAEAKVKARTLYLNYAESRDRQLGYRLDDLYYGMRDRGYLDTMLKNIDAVTAQQVNAAIRRHLQAADLKYVIVTHEKHAEKLADDIANNRNVVSKTLAEYHIAEPVPEDKKAMLAQDERWKAYPLRIRRADIFIVPAARMFETREVIPGRKTRPVAGQPAGAGR